MNRLLGFLHGHGERERSHFAVREREEQKRRSAEADEDYYKAMRRLALEAHDADGVRFYNRKIQDLLNLRYELEALSDREDT